ncbi:hypothetical protein QUH24_27500, partial [Klebsiella pneumoniae]|nr:hypothetical protein [Klebsiella pneumoniae]
SLAEGNMAAIKPNDPLNLAQSVTGIMPRNQAEIDSHVDGLVDEMHRRLEAEFAEESAADEVAD